jgi:hypothetical protein
MYLSLPLSLCVCVCVKGVSDLGLTRWRMRKAMPRKMQREPTTMYAMPKKGFLPPSHEVVDSTTSLVPPKDSTGKPEEREFACE